MTSKKLDALTAEVLKGLQDGTYAVQRITRQQGLGATTLNIEVVDLSTLNVGPPAATTSSIRQTQPIGSTVWQAGGVTGAVAPSGPTGPTGVQPASSIPHTLGIDPVIGYRDFMVADSVTGFVLMSRNKTLWRQRQKAQAFCNGNIYAPHDPPKENCECGIYAFSTPTDIALKSTDVAWAEVALWGDVLICERGYRAQYAYPLSIFLKDTKTEGIKLVRDELEQGYGVPVFLVEERDGKTAADVMGEMIAKELNLADENMKLSDEDMHKLTQPVEKPKLHKALFERQCVEWGRDPHGGHIWTEDKHRGVSYWCPGIRKAKKP